VSQQSVPIGAKLVGVNDFITMKLSLVQVKLSFERFLMYLGLLSFGDHLNLFYLFVFDHILLVNLSKNIDTYLLIRVSNVVYGDPLFQI
jgi:hypothetical protein